jgi:surface protein
MGMMFYNCKTLTSLDLSGWNTSNVTNMNAIFYGCLSLQKLNLSGWDMSKVKTTSFDSIYYKPFTNCNNLTIIYAYGCNTSTINLLNKYKPSNCTLVY